MEEAFRGQLRQLPAIVFAAIVMSFDQMAISPLRFMAVYVGPYLPTELAHHLLPTLEDIVAYAQHYPEAFWLMNADSITLMGFIGVLAVQGVSIVLIVMWAAKSPRTAPWSPSLQGVMWVSTFYASAGAFIAPCALLDFSSSAYRAAVMNPFILWGWVWVILYVMTVLIAYGLVKLTKWAEAMKMALVVTLLRHSAWIALSVGTALLTMCFGVDVKKSFEIWRNVWRMRSEVPWNTLGTKDIVNPTTSRAQCLFLADDYHGVLSCVRTPNWWHRVLESNYMLLFLDHLMYFGTSHVFHFCGSAFMAQVANANFLAWFKKMNWVDKVALALPPGVAAAFNVSMTFAMNLWDSSEVIELVSYVNTVVANALYYVFCIKVCSSVNSLKKLTVPSDTSIGVCVFAGVLVLGLTMTVYQKIRQCVKYKNALNVSSIKRSRQRSQ